MVPETWLLTWTTYGTWLPGDRRGFVGNVIARTDDANGADDASRRVKNNIPGTPYDRSMPGLENFAREHLRGEPVWLNGPQAEVFLEEARRTAEFQCWPLLALAVMANHAHLVVHAPGQTSGALLLQQFKSYGSRALNNRFGKPVSLTWWTKSGSTRLLPNEPAVIAAVEYVRNQQGPLALWIASDEPQP